MNSDAIMDVINVIAGTSSKNEKQALVKQYSAEAEFVKVLVAALDPLTTYGIKKRPVLDADVHVGGLQFTAGTWDILSMLASRKLTGGEAISTITNHMGSLTAKSAELFWRIIIKDLKAGFGDSTCNKAVKGMIREFPYMRCCLPKDAKLEKFSWKSGVFSQEKADGTFANVDVQGGEVRITSRQGTPYPLEPFGKLIDEILLKLPDNTQSHGEFLVFQDGVALERSISNGIMNHVSDGGLVDAGQEIHYFVWDNIPLGAVVPKGRYKVPYAARWAHLHGCLKDHIGCLSLIDTRVVHSLEEARQHFREYVLKGKEGTVFKNGDAIWMDGDSKDQVKLKVDFVVDLKVIAVVPGKENGKNAGRPGSFTCATSDGLLVVDVTVKNEAVRRDVEDHPGKWIEKVVSVVANGVLKPSASNDLHTLFLPRMAEAGYRKDKTVPDSLQRVKDQFEAAIQGTEILKEAA